LGGELNTPTAEAAEAAVLPLPQGEGRGEGTPAGPELTSGRVHFRKNVLSNGAAFVLQIGVGMWFTPYLIRNLGIEAYGLVPLALQVTGYMSILTASLSGSVGRFLTIDLARGDSRSANRTFNTSFFTCLAAAMILLPVALGISYAAPLVLNVPGGQEDGARVLFVATTVSFLLTTLGSNFAVSTFAHSRFDIRSTIEILTLLARVGVVVGIFALLSPSLWIVGVGILAAALVNQTGYLISWHRLTPHLHVRRADFDRTRVRELLGMGGWLTVGSIGWTLYQNVDLVILNTMVSAKSAGLYAPVLQWNSLLRTMAGLVAGVLTPTIIACYARGDKDTLFRLTLQASRLLGLAMALPVGLICGLARPFLSVWLGPEFAAVAPLFWVSILPLAAALTVGPLSSILTAYNRVKVPGLASVAQGGLNLGLALLLTGPLGLGMYGVAASKSCALLASALVFVPLYYSRVTGLPAMGFVKAMALTTFAASALAAAGYVLGANIDLGAWHRLLLVAGLLALVYIAIVFYWILSPEERERVMGLLVPRNAQAA